MLAAGNGATILSDLHARGDKMASYN